MDDVIDQNINVEQDTNENDDVYFEIQVCTLKIVSILILRVLFCVPAYQLSWC